MKRIVYLRLLALTVASIITTTAFVFPTVAQCQIPEWPEWIVYNTDNSVLPSNDGTGLAIDAQGNVWIGTESGFVMFDGGSWTVYRSGLLTSPSFDGQGNLWIGTWGGGLVKFDGVEDWTVYRTSNSGLPHNTAWSTAVDAQGNVWIGTFGGGVAKFNGIDDWTVYNTSNSGLPHNMAWSTTIDAQGNVWIGTDGGGVAKFNGIDDWTVYNTSNSGLPNDNAGLSITIDGQGNVWIGTDGGGVAKFNGIDDWTVYNTSNSGLPSNNVNALAFDGQGNVWIGAQGGGLAKFDRVDDWTVYNTSNSGLPYDGITGLATDAEGNLWIGTGKWYAFEGGGLAVYREGGVIPRGLSAEFAGLTSATRTLGVTLVGQSTPLEVTLVFDAPLEAGKTLRLDLTPLGIPSDLPLEHVGGGRYTGSTAVTPLQNGHHDLPILVETTEGERYRFLTVTLDVYPGGDEYIYQDEMGPTWEVKVAAAELDLTASDIVHQGSYAQAINSQRGYIEYTCKDPDGFSTFGYTALEFWINPGTSSVEKATLALKTTEGSKYLKLVDDLGINLQPNVWQVVSIPLEDLELVDTRLMYIRLRGIEGTFYIDDLAFVVAEYRLAEAAATPEKVKADGTMSTILTVRVVPAVTQPGVLPTVTVDLSPIGGVHDAVMVDDGTGGDKVAGDGIYTIQTTVDPEIQNGLKDLVISSTDSRLRVARAHLPLAVLPTEDVYLYQDQVEAGWKLELYKAESNPSYTDYVHSGSCAHAITLQTGGNIQYTFEDPDGFPAFGYVLEFWVNPGTASIEELTIVAFWHVGAALKTKVLPLVEQWGISFEPETWQQVLVPADSLELTDANLEKIRFVGDVQGTFYIDDMRLVAEEVEITAVEEVSGATALPLGYALSQNYPNPFNLQTTIRYDLPQAGVVRLSLYNVLGQMVRTLVDGHRPAGSYSVIWDGRDGSGREVASGVYLYRLEVKGESVQTRRMVLLR